MRHNQDDRLDNADLIAGLNAAFAPPPGFGPPRVPENKPEGSLK